MRKIPDTIKREALRVAIRCTKQLGSFADRALIRIPGFGRVTFAKFLSSGWIEVVPGSNGWLIEYRITDLGKAEYKAYSARH
jgi:hypothetical protein